MAKLPSYRSSALPQDCSSLSAQPCSSFLCVSSLCLPTLSVLGPSSSLLSICQGLSWGGGGVPSRHSSPNPGSPSKWLSNHIDQIALDLGS